MRGISEEGKTPEELYLEREKRVSDAIRLNLPDRVPVMLELSYFPAKYTGITCEAAYNDYDKWLNACCKTVQDFEPDIVQLTPFFPGTVYELLEPRQLKWPGHGVDPHHAHQFIEGEFMKADEYDAFMDDRSDFMLRCYFPIFIESIYNDGLEIARQLIKEGQIHSKKFTGPV